MWRATTKDLRGQLVATFQSTPSVWRATLTAATLLIRKPFQSTPSVWRATFTGEKYGFADINFNPRPPCGGRPLRNSGKSSRAFAISIHALCVEGDHSRPILTFRVLLFQSTPSVGRATAFEPDIRPVILFQSTPSVGRAT